MAPDGFALVEAVVALAIVAAILGATFQALAAVRIAMTSAQAHRLAALEGRSLVAQLGSTIPLVPGSSEGSAGSLHWRVDVGTLETRAVGFPLRHAVVTVFDRNDKPLLRLDALRLAR